MGGGGGWGEFFFFFFFQAEDGIRDRVVTGVQTCALPISTSTHTRNNEVVELCGPDDATIPTAKTPRPHSTPDRKSVV